jgi:TolB protein
MNKLIIIFLYVLCVSMVINGCGTTDSVEHKTKNKETPDTQTKTQDASPIMQSAELITQLIQQLGSNDWQTREKAQKLLEEIGEPAESVLKETSKNPDLEIRTRATELLHKIKAKRPGKIAFVKDGNIWTMDSEGQNQIQLTKIGATYPVWSPDGKKIAFSSKGQIYTIDEKGGNLTQLTKDVDVHICEPYRSPYASNLTWSWSPDAKKIAFTSKEDNPGFNFNVYVINVDGTNQRKLIQDPIKSFAPSWLSNTKIMFVSPQRIEGNQPEKYHIYVKDINSNEQIKLTKGEGFTEVIDATASPDGKNIAVTGKYLSQWNFLDRDLYVMDSNGENIRELPVAACFLPIWSPDSQKIVCGWYFSHRKSYIYVIDADGNNQKLLMTPDLYDIENPTVSPYFNKVIVRIHYCGQGRKPRPKVPDNRNGMFIINIDDGDRKKLGGEECWSPAWQPNPKEK